MAVPPRASSRHPDGSDGMSVTMGDDRRQQVRTESVPSRAHACHVQAGDPAVPARRGVGRRVRFKETGGQCQET